jgi:hypothetical protein
MVLLLQALLLLSCLTAQATILISESDARLPMGLSSVITDLEAEGVEHVTTACLLTSRGVTLSKRSILAKSLFGLEERGGSYLTAFGTTPEEDDVDGLAIAQPDAQASASEIASTVVACGGTVVYVPSPIDLLRGEGLFDGLGPAMERLLNINDNRKSCLVVVVPDGTSAQDAKSQLERAATTIIPSLVHPPKNKRAVVLEDVFDVVTYVTPSPGQTLEDFLTEQLESSCAPSEALSSVASTVDVLSLVTSAAANAMSWSSIKSPQDLAAARQLGPAARAGMDRALALVRETIRAQGGLVLNYGELCDAVVAQAMQQMQTIKGSSVAKQIKHGLQEELYAELGDVVLQEQLKMLEMASFEEFRKSLSQLKVSPLLPQEMKNAVSKSIASFAQKTDAMVSKKAKPSWSTAPAKMEYARMLKDSCAERLLAAQASGAFRPIPRKGVTVGLHWLLPKPFGNDFRQEPWTVHAMDNLVYVPPDKVTNVSPDDVKSDNWRNKIVPSPASRDMVYMQ